MDAITRSGAIAKQSERASLIALDLARGLAAVVVMLVHVRLRSFVELGALPSSEQSWRVGFFFAATRLGQEAVLLFFVLSGLLVGGQIIRRAKSGTFTLKSYGIDRCSIPLISINEHLLPNEGHGRRNAGRASYPQVCRHELAKIERSVWICQVLIVLEQIL